MLGRIISTLKLDFARRPRVPDARFVCILGMHRSGTSCLTGALEKWGVYLADVSKKNPHNLKGNHENRDIVALNDDILAASGGAWDRPPAKVTWTRQHTARLAEILEDFEGHSVCGFKDPRCVLTLDFWLNAFPNLEMIGTIRNPVAVARSLNKRDSKFPMAAGIRLWEEYNRRILELHRQRPFPIINFDADKEAYRATLGKLHELLHLEGSTPDDLFFEEELRHQTEQTEAPELTESARSLHAELVRLAV